MAQEMRAAQAPALADPAPLGLAAFALTTFVLSAHNAGLFGTVGNTIVVGLAIFYGGLAQFMAGVWVFLRGKNFLADAFFISPALLLSLGTYMGFILSRKGKNGNSASSLRPGLVALV